MSAPLAGVRVLDLTHFVAGPWCTMLLADLGAEVVKVEPPGVGEIGRRMGGVYAGEESAIFLAFNRNKRSVALDLKRDEGRAAVHRLAERADVVVHNLRPGTPERLGVDAPRLRALNAGLVYCAISAFGNDGPYASQPANDPIIQAISGAMLPTGEAGEAPIRMGVPVPDFGSGVLAAIAVTAALHRRALTGAGVVADLSLLDAQVFALADRIGPLLSPGSDGSREGSIGSGAYRCADGGFLYLEIEDEEAWCRLCGALDRADWLDRRTPDARELLEAELATRPRADWVIGLTAAAIPAAPVNSLREAVGGARHLTFDATHLSVGELALMRTPVAADPAWPARRSPPPLLGEHTADVLAEAGYDPETIAELERSGVVG